MLYNVGTWFAIEDQYWNEIHPEETGETITPQYWGTHGCL